MLRRMCVGSVERLGRGMTLPFPSPINSTAHTIMKSIRSGRSGPVELVKLEALIDLLKSADRPVDSRAYALQRVLIEVLEVLKHQQLEIERIERRMNEGRP